MKLLKYILLINTVLVVQVVATRTLAQEVKKDSVIPSQKDAVALAQSVCGASNVNQEKGKLSCKVCPSFTGSGSGGTLTSVVFKIPHLLISYEHLLQKCIFSDIDSILLYASSSQYE
ncbi:MAG: hypothetical protein RM021_024500 [Nostoc sp. EkiNYC01]|nr:hypothetical protein [Nostoc sp. EkiNYC01]